MKNYVHVLGNRYHMKKCEKCGYLKRDTNFIVEGGEIQDTCLSCGKSEHTAIPCSRCLILVGRYHNNEIQYDIDGKNYCGECYEKLKGR